MFSAGLKLRHFYDFQFDFVDEHLANYYRYYRRYAPKVDIRIVIAVTLTIISVIQVHFVLPHCKSYLLCDKMVSYYFTHTSVEYRLRQAQPLPLISVPSLSLILVLGPPWLWEDISEYLIFVCVSVLGCMEQLQCSH